MGNKVTVTSRPKNRIQINTRTGISGGAGTDTLVELKDVDATGGLHGNNTVVYDEASGKFKIEELPIVNGGTF